MTGSDWAIWRTTSPCCGAYRVHVYPADLERIECECGQWMLTPFGVRRRGARSACPNEREHTPKPAGYLSWESWAQDMVNRGYRQRRCSGCGRYEIWVGTKEAARIEDHGNVCLTARATRRDGEGNGG